MILVRNFDYEIKKSKIIITASSSPRHILTKDGWMDIEQEYADVRDMDPSQLALSLEQREQSRDSIERTPEQKRYREYRELTGKFTELRLRGQVILDTDDESILENINVYSRTPGVKEIEKQAGIKYPYHYLWIDGAENISGVTIFPKTTYSRLYTIKDDKVIDIPEGKEGDEKPYYEKKDGKTYIYHDGYSPDGSEENPWEVATYEDLKHVGCEDTSGDYAGWDLDSYYIQTADIQCPTGVEQDNFSPIGPDHSNKFQGSYDGQTKIIKDLYIDRNTTDNIGLFGRVDSGAIVKNAILEDVSIEGRNTVGGLIGFSEGEIENCKVAGNVTGNNDVGGFVGIIKVYAAIVKLCRFDGIVSGNDNVGGFVGRQYDSGEIEECSAKGEVEGKDQTGGFAGENAGGMGNAYIKRSYFIGSVTGEDNTGGFVGANFVFATCSDCYSRGVVNNESNSALGGFCGYNYWSTISRCYSAVEVQSTGGSNINGFIGLEDNSTTQNNYYDKDVAGKTDTVGAAPKSTAEMKDIDTFLPEWDFDDVWGIDS